VKQETIRFLIMAAIYGLALVSFAFLLTGCASVEGAGFGNTGAERRPVVCREISPGYIKCRSQQ